MYMSPTGLKNKKVKVKSLIVSRKDYQPIYAISQQFHLHRRPLIGDASIDLVLKPKVTAEYAQSSTGVRRFFHKGHVFPSETQHTQFPNARRNHFQRLCKGQNTSESKIILKYDKRMPTYTDFNTLKLLNKENSKIKKEIKSLSSNLNKIEGEKAKEDKEEKKEFITKKIEKASRNVEDFKSENIKVLRYLKSSKKVPVSDAKWQVDIRKARRLISYEENSLDIHHSSTYLQSTHKFCSTCKIDWDSKAHSFLVSTE